jgi:hypothetical protein
MHSRVASTPRNSVEIRTFSRSLGSFGDRERWGPIGSASLALVGRLGNLGFGRQPRVELESHGKDGSCSSFRLVPGLPHALCTHPFGHFSRASRGQAASDQLSAANRSSRPFHRSPPRKWMVDCMVAMAPAARATSSEVRIIKDHQGRVVHHYHRDGRGVRPGDLRAGANFPAASDTVVPVPPSKDFPTNQSACDVG